MIDTDKYEGTVWDLKGQFRHDEMASEVLLLVAEVERLRKGLQDIRIDALLMMANGVDAWPIVLQAERVLQVERGEEE